MQVRYWVFKDGDKTVALRRQATQPAPEWERLDPQEAPAVVRMLDDGSGRSRWVVVKIHEIDYHALLGDGWKEFAFEPTSAQRERCKTNHQGRSLEEVSAAEGFRWEELVAILTDQPWRRLVPMRAFTVARDWPLSVPQ